MAMEKESKLHERMESIGNLSASFPDIVIEALISVARNRSTEIYCVGGTVRDWLLGKQPNDLDLTVSRDAELFCRELMRELRGGTYVQLGTEEEEAARVVWNGLDIDISSFRGNTITIEDDLALRDFSINGLAVGLTALADGVGAKAIIDPMRGLADLQSGSLHHFPKAFEDDPLRLVRAFRFMATLGFEICEETKSAIAENAEAITTVAAERVHYELDKIMLSSESSNVLWAMHKTGLLKHIIPELYEGSGVEQPGFHHLDVFHHNFQALREMERLLKQPSVIYSHCANEITQYLECDRVRVCLKWAALLHDVGKPAAQGESVDESRVTFYGHDEIGKKQFEGFARRLKWSNEDRDRAAGLIAMHMHPFHLCTVQRQKKISPRAALKLCRKAGEDLHGVFLLAMSDSLASLGELKPEDIEEELVHLYRDVTDIYREHILPALSGPPLLGGSDLIREFGLTPGPIFSEILDELQSLQVEGQVNTRDDALAWVEKFLSRQQG